MASAHCALSTGKFKNKRILCFQQVAMATGQVLFHRFFYSKSFVKHSFEVSFQAFGVVSC